MTDKGSQVVVVTGAGGFVGGTVANALVQHGMKVIAHVRRPNDGTLLNCEIVNGDLQKTSTFQKFPKRVSNIVHAAANSGRRGESYKQLYEDNVLAARNVAAFAESQHRARVINLSSVSVYGDVREGVLDRSTEIRRPGMYGSTKYAAESVLLESKTFSSISLRLPGILGAGAHENWIVSLVSRAVRDESITFFNPNAPFNNVVHVNDLADFIFRLLEMQEWPKADAFPLASRSPISILATVRLICDELRSRSALVPQGKRLPCFVIDDSHARLNYGYQSRTTKSAVTRFAGEARYG